MLYRTGSILFLLILICSCAAIFQPKNKQGISSSLVDFLYPDGEVPPNHEKSKPHLRLPIVVGLAFVPPSRHSIHRLPEAKKSQLLSDVKQKFVNLDYVKDIIVIPDTYMRSKRGFESVDQLARLYGLDVMALVSYDQVLVSTERKRSILYWTIVGAYFIKGNQSNTTTFVDTAVFDVESRKILFRAPGLSEIELGSSLVDLKRKNLEAMEKGFEQAMEDMSQNLAIEVDKFEQTIENQKTNGNRDVEVSNRKGFPGIGSIELQAMLLLLGVVIFRRLTSGSTRD